MKTKSPNSSLLGVLVAVVLIGLALAWLRNTPTATPQPTQPRQSTPAIAVAADAPAPGAAQNTATQQQPSRTPAPSATKTATKKSAKATPHPPSNTVDGWVVRNVKIYDLDNNLVYKGDVDIEPTLDRIANGIRDSHRNDGSTFGNFERKLPGKPRGYYTEYVLRTPGLSGVGPQRVILGRNDEVYYTPDHYITFVRVK